MIARNGTEQDYANHDHPHGTQDQFPFILVSTVFLIAFIFSIVCVLYIQHSKNKYPTYLHKRKVIENEYVTRRDVISHISGNTASQNEITNETIDIRASHDVIINITATPLPLIPVWSIVTNQPATVGQDSSDVRESDDGQHEEIFEPIYCSIGDVI